MRVADYLSGPQQLLMERHLVRSPIRSSPTFDAIEGRTVLVKDETVQHGGSFKYRGALLGVEAATSGVVAAGAGNFPIAVGLAASRLGKLACLVVPDDVPSRKLFRLRALRTELHLVPRASISSFANEIANDRGWRNLHAFEDQEMTAGSSSLGLEMAVDINEYAGERSVVIVACGGGGLASGIALALRERCERTDIIVAEPETLPRYAHARVAGQSILVDPLGETICDALGSRRIGNRAFDILEQSNVKLCRVADDDVRAAVISLREYYNVQAEPSGALAFGALLGGQVDSSYELVWIVVCGGNA